MTDKYLAYYNVGSFYMYETLARTRKRLTKEQLETAVEVLHIILDEMRSDMPELKSIY